MNYLQTDKIIHTMVLPPTTGKIINEYLQKIKENEVINGYTLSESLEIISCKCKISNNKRWNHHNNYDNSELEMYVKVNTFYKEQWFTLDLEEAKNIQKLNIEKRLLFLKEEINKLKCLI